MLNMFEVGARAHQDVLHDVGERPTPFPDPVVQDLEVPLEENQVRGILGHVDGVRDGDPNVGGVEGRGIVDAVAQEAHDVVVAFERKQDARLLRRGDAGEDVGPLGHRGQGRVGHAVQVLAENNLAGVEPDLGADVAGHELVVSGQDLDADPIAPESGDRLGHVRHEEIGEGEETDEREGLLIDDAIGGLGHDLAGGHGQDPGPGGAQRLVRRAASGLGHRTEGLAESVALDRRAHGQDALGRPLRDEKALAGGVHDHGHAAALEVEGDLVHLQAGVFARRPDREDGGIQGAADARLVDTVDRPAVVAWVRAGQTDRGSGRGSFPRASGCPSCRCRGCRGCRSLRWRPGA
jgi:hypothetical protein